jgi:hypothetical protein
MIATIILLCLHASKFFYNTLMHKEKIKSEYNSFHSLFATIIYLILYYYAGLFDKF